jgi:hypothetical protein
MEARNINVFEVNEVSDAIRAIDKIKQQGEGTPLTPEDGDSLSEIDLAHFYRFREILRGHKFIKDSQGNWIDDPTPLPFPETFEMADVPEGGYPEVSKDFDRMYTTLLKTLQSAWENGRQEDLDDASFVQMGDLTTEAIRLMQKPIDPNDASKGNFAPDFRIV